jgi:hypothetical protein
MAEQRSNLAAMVRFAAEPEQGRERFASVHGTLAAPAGAALGQAWQLHDPSARHLFPHHPHPVGQLALPDLNRISRQPGLTAGDLRDQFAAANLGWSARGVGLVLDDGWLQEVRLCYDRRFRPAVCDRTRFGPPDTAPLRIWRGL